MAGYVSLLLAQNTNWGFGRLPVLREQRSAQHEGLSGAVATQRAILKKNGSLQRDLKKAMRIDAQNKKLMAERQELATENVDLEERRAALQTASTRTARSTAYASAAMPKMGSKQSFVTSCRMG